MNYNPMDLLADVAAKEEHLNVIALIIRQLGPESVPKPAQDRLKSYLAAYKPTLTTSEIDREWPEIAIAAHFQAQRRASR